MCNLAQQLASIASHKELIALWEKKLLETDASAIDSCEEKNRCWEKAFKLRRDLAFYLKETSEPFLPKVRELKISIDHWQSSGDLDWSEEQALVANNISRQERIKRFKNELTTMINEVVG